MKWNQGIRTAGIPAGRVLLVAVEFRNFQAALLQSKDRNKLFYTLTFYRIPTGMLI